MSDPAKFARILAWLACAAFSAVTTDGCARRVTAEPSRSNEPTARDAGAATPTWTHDIAPLLARRCGGCHGDAATAPVAPPALATYDQARAAATTSLRAIRRRMMPPFGADDTGLCGTWNDAAWLTDAEVAAFGAWAERGMPRGEGEPAFPPVVAEDDAAPAIVDPGVAFAPGVGGRAYRCFLAPAPKAPARLLAGITVVSEPRAAIRQADLYALATPAGIRQARALDATDREPGWPCFGAPAVTSATLVGSWSRNTPSQRSTDRAGLPLSTARAFIAQVRYDLLASPPGVPVRARFLPAAAAPAVHRPARLVAVRPSPFALAPRRAQVGVSAAWTVDRASNFRGLIPGMHTLGRTLDLEVVSRAGTRRCLAHFGHWDIYDRQLFRAAAPVPLEPGDQVGLTCTYATSSRDADTKMGEAPDEEQCLAHLYLVD